ncbi:MAG: universal stress protein, partial [Pseudomonadota bacterium]
FEAALFESGRPLLIAPPVMSGADVSAASFGTHAVISWNCSTEAAHTVAAALPVLLAADRVTILTVEGAIVPGPDAAALADYLAIHGITATQVAKPRSSMGPGKAILEATRELGGDLLIESAYTQSRLRQMIFGGATAEVLAETTLPVFMAN